MPQIDHIHWNQSSLLSSRPAPALPKQKGLGLGHPAPQPHLLPFLPPLSPPASGPAPASGLPPAAQCAPVRREREVPERRRSAGGSRAQLPRRPRRSEMAVCAGPCAAPHERLPRRSRPLLAQCVRASREEASWPRRVRAKGRGRSRGEFSARGRSGGRELLCGRHGVPLLHGCPAFCEGIGEMMGYMPRFA
ncbi:hypothetical protein SETIT_4G199500v2 [Setaria italica]|uniref:Uncharacterized protein n=1 Tax=Setaria italica TaxID=4555 RepID=A0A368QWH2_SETIT|nr:hypothetical protein SETIT_4G199500v2 [Setaria italica]